MTPRIFVSLAAYRDAECQRTLDDLFAKAAHPERVVVGLCWQTIPETDADLRPTPARPDQVRMVEIDAKDSLGACWARNLIQGLWQGEEYFLQIDAHSHFVEGWDEAMIEVLAACPSERAVLSAYPPPYTPPAALRIDHIRRFSGVDFSMDGIPTPSGWIIPIAEAPPLPIPAYQCSGAFIFGPGAIVAEVPYDPHIYFYGEETTYAARLWTHGWDLFCPHRLLLWHNYLVETRPRHWNDNQHGQALRQRSDKRVRHILGMAETDDAEALVELDRYGLGSARSLADYQAAAGVDFRRQLVNGLDADEREIAMVPAARRRRNLRAFEQPWEDGSWGTHETRSGSGATMRGSALVRDALPGLLDELAVEILADAGCGELNWMNLISPRLRLYLGIDIMPRVVSGLVQRFGRRTGHFFAELDITQDILPRCDAILCRDVLTHYPAVLVWMILERFKASGSRYLITTQAPTGTNRDIKVGRWQPIDLTAPPFNFPPPLRLIADGKPSDNKFLAVWRIEDIPPPPRPTLTL